MTWKLQPLTAAQLDRFRAAALRTGCSTETVEEAAAVVAGCRPVLLGLSGWPTAGKDVLGAEVFANLGLDSTHLYFAQPLKDEVDSIIRECRGRSITDAIAAVAVTQQVSSDDAAIAVDIIHTQAQDPEVHARTRTPVMRHLLQTWGTTVRRRTDEDYWVNQALRPAVEAIANGEHVYLSDVRFPNEVVRVQALGFTVVRLDVSAKTVQARLTARDNITATDEDVARLLAVPTESLLDQWQDFNLRFTNERSVAHGVATIVRHLTEAEGLSQQLGQVA